MTPDVMGIKLAYAGPTARPTLMPASSARIVPENITLLPKTASRNDRRQSVQRKGRHRQEGRHASPAMLRDLGAAPDDIDAIAKVLGAAAATAASRKARSCACCCRPMPGTKQLQPVRVIIAGDIRDRRGRGAVGHGQIRAGRRAQRRHRSRRQRRRSDRRRRRHRHPPLSEHLRDGAAQPGAEAGDRRTRCASTPTTSTSSAACSRATRSKCCMPARTSSRPPTAATRCCSPSLTVGGETKKFYRFQSPDDGLVDYYDETGKSAKKFLVRKPVGRRHHALRLRHPPPSDPRLHQDAHRRRLGGADRHADLRRRQRRRSRRPAGKSATASTSCIRHTNGYETAYGHMTRLCARHGGRQARAPGPGDRLRRLDRPVDRRARALRNPASTAASSIRCASSCRAAAS